MLATIKKNKNTSGHRAMLESKGYKVEENATHLLVEVTELVNGEYDLTKAEGREAVQAAISAKKGFDYRTKWTLPEETRSHSGIFALRKLGRLSAFVMKGPDAPKKPAVSDAMLAVLGTII